MHKDNDASSSSSQQQQQQQSLVFQDVLQRYQQEDPPNDNDISLAFFELANAPEILYRLPDGVSIRIQQDSNAETHTGGVVWETSYLLTEYLLAKTKQKEDDLPAVGPQTVLELGAGCGLLGTALALTACRTAGQAAVGSYILTETPQVLQHVLAKNVQRHQALLLEQVYGRNKNDHATTTMPVLRSCALDWRHVERDARCQGLEPHSMDCIVGTDVVFCPTLVEPLLKTIRHLAHAQTNIYLCVQVRCAASHQRLLEKAGSYGLTVQNVTDELDDWPHLQWGKELECHLLRLQVQDD